MITIALLGDVNLGASLNRWLWTVPPAEPWGDVLDLLAAADLRVCNLECTLADRGRKWLWPFKKYYHRSATRNAAVLSAAGIDVAVLANNHTMDFGADGLRRTIATLDERGIRHVGAGVDRAAAEAPLIFTVGDLRVGIVAFMDERWGAAGPDRPGHFYSPIDLRHARAARVLDAVRAARPRVELLIASAHWGPNWGDGVSPAIRAFGRALIDAGADFVFGHSGHVTRGVEVHAGRPILYSAGDALDGYVRIGPGRHDRGAVFLARWDEGRITQIDALPIVIRDRHARLAPAGESGQIGARLQRLCAALGTRTEPGPRGRVEIRIPPGI